MTEQKALGVGPAGIDIAYERIGDPDLPPVLLIIGSGSQLIHWPDEFCTELVTRGLQVIRFDNRDSGRSTMFSDAPAPDIMAAIAGDMSSASYTLADMAADTVGLLDVLDIDSAHLVGISLGGMIGQTMAIEYPQRVRSLTSIASTTGNPEVGQTHPGVFGDTGPQPHDRAGYIEWRVRVGRALASPGFAFDAEAVAETAGRAYDRGHDLTAMMRQMVAVVASGDRTSGLEAVQVPALVIHGSDDRMFDVSGGRATAAAIPGAELMIVDGLGHALPRELWSTFAERIGDLVQRVEA